MEIGSVIMWPLQVGHGQLLTFPYLITTTFSQDPPFTTDDKLATSQRGVDNWSTGCHQGVAAPVTGPYTALPRLRFIITTTTTTVFHNFTLWYPRPDHNTTYLHHSWNEQSNCSGGTDGVYHLTVTREQIKPLKFLEQLHCRALFRLYRKRI